MGFLDWLSLLSFAWLRRCKACGARGSRCVCKRPSLALEHIFFLEERKNKLGARNFSHVSDTMMTAGTNSSLLTASTFSGGFSTVALPNGGQVVTSGNGTVLMGGGADSISDCASVDYIYPAQSFASSHSSGQQQQVVSSRSLGHGHSHHHRHHRRSRREEREPASTALVTKSSASAGRFTSKDKIGGRHVVRFEELPPNEMVVAGNNAGGRNWRPQHPPPPPPRQPPQQRAAPFRAENPLLSRDKQQQQQQQGCSFQFYGRGGSGQGSSYVSNGYAANGYTGNGGYASTSSSGGYASTDSLALRPSVQSTASFSSDRMSVDNNFGSYNPRGGRLLEGGGGAGYAPSIQEDDEALQRLDGWLHASPTSTADSFAMSRPMY